MDSPQTAPDGASSSQSQQAMGPPNAFMAMAGHAKMVALNVLKEVSCQAQQWQSCLQQALCVSEEESRIECQTRQMVLLASPAAQAMGGDGGSQFFLTSHKPGRGGALLLLCLKPQILDGRRAAVRPVCSRWAALAPLQAPHQQHSPALCAAVAACHMLQWHTQGLHWHAAVPTLRSLLDSVLDDVHAFALVAAGLSSKLQNRGQTHSDYMQC